MKLHIGANIRTLRRQADMTQEQLAERLGVTYQSVSRWENEENYPDLELIPRIASIFEVTADTLLATTESVEERYQMHIRALREAAEENNTDKAADILKSIEISARDFKDQFFGDLLTAMKTYKFMEDPRIAIELKKIAEAYLKYGSTHREYLIQSLAEWVEDDGFENFLDTYASHENLTRNALRLHRYQMRGGHRKELVELEQRNLYNMIMDICLAKNTWQIPCGASPAYSAEYVRYQTTFCLDLLHRFNCITPDKAHPVSGNGEADIFVAARLYLGIALAAVQAYENDRDGMYTALEDTVVLLEKITGMGEILTQEQISMRFANRKDKTHEGLLQELPNITCSAPAMDGYTGGVGQQWALWRINGKLPEYHHSTMIYLPYNITPVYNHRPYEQLSGKFTAGYTTWFKPFREEERYKTLLQRTHACIRTRPLTE
ncbi:MAG: helix-turn-helix domain-containing protein [Clostridia bacterium]|nr:helix-turn-helix domain-containing protein [Clostridia bacterium]